LAKNPNGRVPVLEDDGFFLSESHAIMLYLADKTPGQTVYPSEPKARADVHRWLFWSAQHFAPAIAVLNWERVVKPMIGAGPPSEHEEQRGERLVKEFAQVLDGCLKGRTWLAQDRLTLADLAVAAPLMSMRPARLRLEEMPHLLAWFRRVEQLPAWQKTIAGPQPAAGPTPQASAE
jgi:glutathione S-transferase